MIYRFINKMNFWSDNSNIKLLQNFLCKVFIKFVLFTCSVNTATGIWAISICGWWVFVSGFGRSCGGSITSFLSCFFHICFWCGWLWPKNRVLEPSGSTAFIGCRFSVAALVLSGLVICVSRWVVPMWWTPALLCLVWAVRWSSRPSILNSQ